MAQHWRTILGTTQWRTALLIGAGSVVDIGGVGTRNALARLVNVAGGLEHDEAIFRRAVDGFERQQASAEEAPPPPGWLVELGVEQTEGLGDIYPEILAAKRIAPTIFHEARAIGLEFRSGNSVLIDLRAMDAADARRLVDFAAGLALGLRGSIRRIANRVFLLYGATEPAAAQENRTAQRRRDIAAEMRSVLEDPGEAV